VLLSAYHAGLRVLGGPELHGRFPTHDMMLIQVIAMIAWLPIVQWRGISAPPRNPTGGYDEASLWWLIKLGFPFLVIAMVTVGFVWWTLVRADRTLIAAAALLALAAVVRIAFWFAIKRVWLHHDTRLVPMT
jgi:hypothetical protein